MDRTFAAMDEFRRRMDRLFDDYYRGIDEPHGRDVWPRMTMHDEGTKLMVYAEVPGLGEKDIQLSVNQDVLSISGERKVVTPEGFKTHRQERGSIRFNRSVALPCSIDPERAGAMVKDGILTITLEKAVEAQPRQIAIKTR